MGPGARTHSPAWVLLAALVGTGCTLISGVNDFEVNLDDAGGGDAGLEGGGADGGDDGEVDAGPGVVDARITLTAMSPHPTQIVDCAVVDAEDRLMARGLFRMPPAVGGDYPDVTMTLEGVLVGEAPYELLFFADINENGVADVPPIDHSWIRELDDDGEISFAHSFPLDDLSEDEDEVQPIGADLVMTFADDDDDPRDAFALRDDVYELRIVPPDGRVVGLVQLHPDVETPLPDALTLRGIVDSGNTYSLEVSVDGTPVDGGQMEFTAPTAGNLEIELTRDLFGL